VLKSNEERVEVETVTSRKPGGNSFRWQKEKKKNQAFHSSTPDGNEIREGAGLVTSELPRKVQGKPAGTRSYDRKQGKHL